MVISSFFLYRGRSQYHKFVNVRVKYNLTEQKPQTHLIAMATFNRLSQPHQCLIEEDISRWETSGLQTECSKSCYHQYHEDELRLFCTHCRVIICDNCNAGEHFNHTLQSVDQLVKHCVDEPKNNGKSVNIDLNKPIGKNISAATVKSIQKALAALGINKEEKGN
ncbi:uncharacterized protein LOC129771248 isoform X2 [Toxorhynchites rutilus septentrionalis]|uniref:uncharacterized protein LOC129771248 isoform X2 n=1 Tax=Toxorhynchites rutilus septentrionalis TaxID=329112 RepID=UPI00247AFB14|nr:uncharacterized protein LOC129771248 isoform X2 [Toxorhynchites rutilus septentrionalis]